MEQVFPAARLDGHRLMRVKSSGLVPMPRVNDTLLMLAVADPIFFTVMSAEFRSRSKLTFPKLKLDGVTLSSGLACTVYITVCEAVFVAESNTVAVKVCDPAVAVSNWAP